MNPDPDYSAAYVVLRTDAGDGLEGHGLTFTIGRGTEVVVAAVEALRPLVVGPVGRGASRPTWARFWRDLVGDSQLRWIGPEKGVIHLATAAVVNAVWDLVAKRAGVPVWKLLSAMTPAEIVGARRFPVPDRRPDARPRHSSCSSEPSPGRREREAELLRDGYPAYTTSVGWLGYDDDKIRRLCREALADGWTRFKMKVGADVEDDVRRMAIIRDEIGPDRMLAVDANQRWDVGDAIDWMARLAPFDPYWIEEPTSPDDILGHAAIARAVAPIRVATGEHVHNRIMFKQFLAAGALSVCQIDACRLGWRQRGRRGPAAGREVRRDRLPARRRRRPVRAGPAPVRLRLHRGQRAARRPDDRVRRPSARAFRRSGRHPSTGATDCPIGPATAPRCTPRRWRAIAIRTDRLVVRRFGQVIRVKPELDRRLRTPARRDVARRPRRDRRGQHPQLLDLSPRRRPVRLLRVRRRRPRGGHGGDGRGPDDRRVVVAHRRHAGSLPGARAGQPGG